MANDQAKSHFVDLSDTFLANDHVHNNCFKDDHTSDVSFQCPVSNNQLVERQKSDSELSPLLQEALCESKAAKVPICYYMKSGILMHKWRPPTVAADEEWQVSHKIVVPNCYHADILSLVLSRTFGH